MDIIKGSQQNFERYVGMVDRMYENFNSEFIDIPAVHGKIENDEIGKPI